MRRCSSNGADRVLLTRNWLRHVAVGYSPPPVCSLDRCNFIKQTAIVCCDLADARLVIWSVGLIPTPKEVRLRCASIQHGCTPKDGWRRWRGPRRLRDKHLGQLLCYTRASRHGRSPSFSVDDRLTLRFT